MNNCFVQSFDLMTGMFANESRLPILFLVLLRVAWIVFARLK